MNAVYTGKYLLDRGCICLEMVLSSGEGSWGVLPFLVTDAKKNSLTKVYPLP